MQKVNVKQNNDLSDVSSPALRELMSKSTVSEQVAGLRREGERFSMLAIRCDHCKSTIANQMIRGRAKRIKPWLVAVRAEGFCTSCTRTTPIQVLLHSNGIVELNRNGNWVTKRPSRLPGVRQDLEFKSQQLLRNVETLYEKTRAGLAFLYQHRNDDLSALFSRPALLGRADKR